MKNNMTSYLLMSVILASLATCSCGAGKHCIKVGGAYSGIDGEIEYCYDVEKSKEAKANIYTAADGQTALLLTEANARNLIRARNLAIVLSEISWRKAFEMALGLVEGKKTEEKN